MSKPKIKVKMMEIVDEEEYGTDEPVEVEVVIIEWDKDNSITVPIYEPEGRYYIPSLQCVILTGHEELKVVTKEDGIVFKTYTR